MERWNHFSFVRIVPLVLGGAQPAQPQWGPSQGEIFWPPLSLSSSRTPLWSLCDILLSELCFEKAFDSF